MLPRPVVFEGFENCLNVILITCNGYEEKKIMQFNVVTECEMFLANETFIVTLTNETFL